MLLLLLHQLAVCLSLFALVILSVNCLDLLCGGQLKKRKKSKPVFFVMAVLWVTTLFGTLYEGVYLAEKTVYGAWVTGCGLAFLIPVFALYFRQTPFPKKELVFVLCFYLVSIINVFFLAYYISDILCSLFVLVLGGYVAKRSASIQRIRQWMERYFMLLAATFGTSTVKTVEKLRRIWLNQDKVAEIDKILTEEVRCSKITLDKLARKVRTNRTYASRYFNEQKGMSFLLYVKTVRFEKVEAGLTDAGKSITDVYEEAGFESSTFFSSFKNAYQMTPKEWKRMNKSGLLYKKEKDS